MRLNSFILSLILCFFVTNTIASQQCLILLHGLSRTTLSMSSLAFYFKKANYIVINQAYPTTRKTIQQLALQDVPSMVKQCQQYKPTKINFVTHSMGGLVLRAYLQNNKLANLGRVVMLAPPNHGSPFADTLQNNLAYKAFLGPAAGELTTNASGIPNSLDPNVKYPVGVIAGNFSFNPFMKDFFHGENDGKVSVESTRLAGMKDFIVLPVSHTFIMHNKLVIQEVAHFLQYGSFDHHLYKL